MDLWLGYGLKLIISIDTLSKPFEPTSLVECNSAIPYIRTTHDIMSSYGHIESKAQYVTLNQPFEVLESLQSAAPNPSSNYTPDIREPNIYRERKSSFFNSFFSPPLKKNKIF